MDEFPIDFSSFMSLVMGQAEMMGEEGQGTVLWCS